MKSQNRVKYNIDRWIVMEGRPVFTCRTRKQARAFFKKNKVHYPKYQYVGKVSDEQRKIILDV